MTRPVIEAPQLVVVDAAEQVWRVGFKPEPWARSRWEWAGADGRFHGRWDDQQGNFRTITPAPRFRPACSSYSPASGRTRPSRSSSTTSWRTTRTPRCIRRPRLARSLFVVRAEVGASATLTGRFCVVTAAESIAALRRQFVALAHLLSLHDFDAAALKDGRPRALTQSVATFLHATTDLDGVTFASGTATTSPCEPGSNGPQMRRPAGPWTLSSTTHSPLSTPTCKQPSGSSALAGRTPDGAVGRCPRHWLGGEQVRLVRPRPPRPASGGEEAACPMSPRLGLLRVCAAGVLWGTGGLVVTVLHEAKGEP